MHNGAVAATECFNLNNSFNCKPNMAVSIEVINASEATRIYGTNYAVTVTGLPVGLAFDATTNKITGTPTTAGISNVTITIKSTQEGLGWVDSSLTCKFCVGEYLTANNTNVTNGTAFTAQLTQTFVNLVAEGEGVNFVPNGAVAPQNGNKYINISYSLANGTKLPRGLSIDSATGAITGTANAAAGTYTVEVAVTLTKVVGIGAFGSVGTTTEVYTAPVTLTVTGEVVGMT